MFENTIWKMEPVGRESNIIKGSKYRFTLLTSRLIRMEYHEDGKFEDHPTQSVWNRHFKSVPHQLTVKGEGFELSTEFVQIFYNGEAFTKDSLCAKIKNPVNAYETVWYYSKQIKNLGGTARTLDNVNGSCPLQDGIQSECGYTIFDDSRSLILTEDGWIKPREGDGVDIYLFAYGTDYKEALKDFYRLTGKTPMLPRYALGNWWSRYYSYTEESYQSLMTRFEKENIPFTVGVIDMDWHLVEDVDPKYGNGWTGYTWNKSLFPHPKEFMTWLHNHGIHVTLNLHPADGIRAYEEAYPYIAAELGNIDTANEEPVSFDIANRQFLEAYFKCVLHPEETRGVDFWWIDWQQGNTTKIPGLDPLWMLNHYHFLDSARDGKRPITFSRYAGPGSHRYPIGFSGDTHVTWESFDFQPYFTSTASNIGYGWWSHDIGGHMMGYKDNELAARWVQFGVFSPVNRLHSSKSDFMGKEPWHYPMEIAEVMKNFLRLRHSLIPYLYTMNYRAYDDNLPLVLPMYYSYPQCREAYDVRNQYEFGTAFIVAPITTPMPSGFHMGKVRVWLPEGIYIDFFTGMIYSGGKTITMYRNIHSIPVLAHAGAIVPMTEEIQPADVCHNPGNLTIRVYGGADGEFFLYEDDNETTSYTRGEAVHTQMKLDWAHHSFTIAPAQGELSLIPDKRTFTVQLYGIKDSEVTATADGKEISACKTYDSSLGCLTVILPELEVTKAITVTLQKGELRDNNVTARIFELLDCCELAYQQKESVYSLVQSELPTATKVAELQALDLNPELMGAVSEILTAQGRF